MPAEPKQLSESFGPYLVARFELLDFQGLLRQLDRPRDEDGTVERETFKGKAADLYGSLCGMRETFMAIYERFAGEDIAAVGLTDAQRDSLRRLLRCEVRFSHYADHVLIYAPMGINRNRIPARTVFAIMRASVEMFSECLLAGNRLHGRLDIGLGMEDDDGAFYVQDMARLGDGKGVILQPGITVGKALRGYLKRTDVVADAGKVERIVNRRFADRCLEALGVDDRVQLARKITLS